MKKILVTGFDPFEGEKINPSYEAVKLLPDKIAGAEIIKLELPTVFTECEEKLVKALKKHMPNYVLCVGQAGGRYEVTPERVGINYVDARIPDNKGNQPLDKKIKKDGKNAYFATLPVKAIAKAIKEAGVPSSVSNTAGTYVCNYIMYCLLYNLDKYPEFKHIKGGFFHVPYLPEEVVTKPNTPSMSQDIMAKGLEVAVKTILTTKNESRAKKLGKTE